MQAVIAVGPVPDDAVKDWTQKLNSAYKHVRSSCSLLSLDIRHISFAACGETVLQEPRYEAVVCACLPTRSCQVSACGPPHRGWYTIMGAAARMQVQLQDVQSFYQEDGKSPFKFMPWKHGAMHYSFEHVRRSLPSHAASFDTIVSWHTRAALCAVAPKQRISRSSAWPIECMQGF